MCISVYMYSVSVCIVCVCIVCVCVLVCVCISVCVILTDPGSFLSCIFQLWRSYGGQEAILSMQLVYQLLMREDVISRVNDFIQMVSI